MSEPSRTYTDAAEASRIYLLPNLMTAGNLFCGFVAVIRCIQAKFVSTAEGAGADFYETVAKSPNQLYEQAVWFILAAVAFDCLDGRLARISNKESLFGKEFDSLADVVSFGMAPSLMVFFLILSPSADFPLVRTLGGLIGFFYLLCVAVRLARFNVITSPLLKPSDKFPKHDFMGLPSPAAAGMISSIVLVMINTETSRYALLLPPLMVLISILMVSNVRYPSFKGLNLRTKTDFKPFLGVFIFLATVYVFHYVAIALVFLAYLFYGLWRHFVPQNPAADMPANKS